MDFAITIAWAQATYFGVTGVWPLVHMPSFLAVTGPKTDLWLVRTVASLIVGVAVALGIAAWRGEMRYEIGVLAMTSSLSLMLIDVIYVARGVISKIYLLDALPEGILILAWVAAMATGGLR